MDFSVFIKTLLGVSDDFSLEQIETDEDSRTIIIDLKYIPKRYLKAGKQFVIYDYAPKRKWQHLNWFQYQCYIRCSLPRYINPEGKETTIDIEFATKSRSYTHKFSSYVVMCLKEIRFQNTAAKLLNTTPYIVRSIMEDSVDYGLEKRGFYY